VTLTHWLSPVGVAEANSPKRVRRQRIQFAAYCGRILLARYSMLPFFLIPPLAVMLAIQAAAMPDLPKWADWGGFAVLSVYMVYRFEKLMRSTIDEFKEIRQRDAAREEALIGVVRDNAKAFGAVMEGVDRLLAARACPYEGPDHPGQKRRPA